MRVWSAVVPLQLRRYIYNGTHHRQRHQFNTQLVHSNMKAVSKPKQTGVRPDPPRAYSGVCGIAVPG